MSSNADVAARYFDDILSHARLDLIEDVFAPDYVDHTARRAGLRVERANPRRFSLFRSAVPRPSGVRSRHDSVDGALLGDIVNSCGSGWSEVHAASCWSSRSMSSPSTNVASARTSATRWGALTQRQRTWAASSSL
jgi:hypothetical protein